MAMGGIAIECGFLNDLLVSVSISLLFTFLMCIQLKVILVKLLDDFQSRRLGSHPAFICVCGQIHTNGMLTPIPNVMISNAAD